MTTNPNEMPIELTPEQRRQMQRYAYLRARLVNFLETEKVAPDMGISLFLELAAWGCSHCPADKADETIEGAKALLGQFFAQHRQRIEEEADA